MHRCKKSTERCVRLLMSRRLLSSKDPIDIDLSKVATSKPLSDRGSQVKGAFQDYLKKNATRRDGMWSRLGDDGGETASPEPPRVTNTPVPYTKRDVGSGRIQNQRTLLNRRDSTGYNRTTTPRPGTPASKETAQQKASMRGVTGGNDKRSRGGGGGGQFDDGGLDGSVQSLLFDHDYFEEMFAGGVKALNYDEMDDVDKLLAYSFQESFKSSTNESTTVLEAPSLKKKVLPRARTMKELYAFMQPDIQSVPEGTPGHSIATQSWPVIQRNMFYSDKDKYKFLETIAKLYNKVEAQYEEQTSSLSKEQEIDLIFRTDFRKGRPFFEEELRLKALSGEGFTEQVVDEYAQADTDWDVQAVEDEDQL